jgi:hypothetical protein
VLCFCNGASKLGFGSLPKVAVPVSNEAVTTCVTEPEVVVYSQSMSEVRMRRGVLVWAGLCAALSFCANNLWRRDARAPCRHPWKWVLFVLIDHLILAGSQCRSPQRSGVLVILVNRLGDAIVAKPLIAALQAHSLSKGDRFMVVGSQKWAALRTNLYANTPCMFIDEEAFTTSLRRRLETAFWLRRQHFGTAICFMHHRLERL